MRLYNAVSRSKTSRAAAALVLIPVIAFLVSLSFQSRKVQAAPAPPPQLEGFHDGATCSQIFGWAWDANQPNTPISVDIFGDNVLITTIPADQFRQDLLDAGKGNGIHAFSVATPISLIDGQAHSIRVRFAGSNIDLGFTPKAISCVEFEGFHDTADCTVIAGWAWDSTQPNTPITVDGFIDNDSFRSILAPANQFRQDLLNAGKGNGTHGFSFSTPSFLKDGQPHLIRIRISGTSVDLGNTPKSINCPVNPPPIYEGFFEVANCNVISGWAWDANQPNTPISVDIYDQNVLLATVLADQFRQDLATAGKGNGSHAFSFVTPPSIKDGLPHMIGVGFHDTALGLTNTPKTINCASAAFEGFHDGANCSQISGWAWDANQPNTPISVDIFSGSVLVTTVPADQFRQDLLNAGKGNGFHAFSIATPTGLKDGQPHSIRIRIASTGIDLGNTPRSITCP